MIKKGEVPERSEGGGVVIKKGEVANGMRRRGCIENKLSLL